MSLISAKEACHEYTLLLNVWSSLAYTTEMFNHYSIAYLIMRLEGQHISDRVTLA